MTTTYVLRDVASDLTGGADFSNSLTVATAGSASIALTILNLATETSFAWTPVGEPGAAGVTGDYSVEVRVVTANADLNLSIQLRRVNSAGTVQASSSATAEQTMSATGVLTFTFTALDLGTWAAGDRLRVDYIFRDTSVHANESAAIGANTTNEEVVTPWTIVATTKKRTTAALLARRRFSQVP